MSEFRVIFRVICFHFLALIEGNFFTFQSNDIIAIFRLVMRLNRVFLHN
nr:MAG TPA_asm: hypothetical protein [Caudoviricetes sp.]